MLNDQIESELNILNNQLSKLKESIKEVITMTPKDIVDNYLILSKTLDATTNGNQRKKVVILFIIFLSQLLLLYCFNSCICLLLS
jgi:hypothetical protein